MAKITGFMDYARREAEKTPVEERIKHFKEFERPLSQDHLHQQAARCMDCGVPHCHTFGCPLHNRIPDWNDLVYQGQWKPALQILSTTDNFPEFTGRVCPAPCEAACTLNLQESPVLIRHIELQIIEKGWKEGWVKPQKAGHQSGKSVAVVGSGPAGLAAAQQLSRRGHQVTVFERDEAIGGLLRYGIPDFKLEKWIIDRRLQQMREEGVTFETGVHAGSDISLKYMKRIFDAIVLATGATVPRDLDIPGREFKGIHLAMEFLTQQNDRCSGINISAGNAITAKDKQVIVIGGGDTGSDCVGTARRQGAGSIVQIELLPKPPEFRHSNNPWPTWPDVLRTSSSQEEGCQRYWSLKTKAFVGEKGRVTGIHAVRVKPTYKEGRLNGFEEIPHSDINIKADLVLLATGFLHTEPCRLIRDAEIDLNSGGDIAVVDGNMTSHPGLFAAGDCVTGASLVVNALHQGRQTAEAVDRFLRKRGNV